jgi:hypothetical protein
MPAGATYEPIATVSPTGTGVVTFSSLGSYTDLRVVANVIGTSAASQIYFRFNGDTGSNYSFTVIRGNGSSALSSRQSSTTYIFAEETGVSTTIPHLLTYDVFSYGGSTNKTVLTTASEDNNGSGNVVRGVGLWRNTAAITSITLTLTGGNYASGSMVTLYGIKAA